MKKLHLLTTIIQWYAVLALSGMAQNREAAFDMNDAPGPGGQHGQLF
jgi:hypothetical protein